MVQMVHFARTACLVFGSQADSRPLGGRLAITGDRADAEANDSLWPMWATSIQKNGPALEPEGR
jgi:hypothetical protein